MSIILTTNINAWVKVIEKSWVQNWEAKSTHLWKVCAHKKCRLLLHWHAVKNKENKKRMGGGEYSLWMTLPCKDLDKGPALGLCELDCSPRGSTHSAFLAAPDSTRRFGCPGTWPVSTLCMTASAWRGQLELTVPVHCPTSVPSCHQTLLSSNGRSTLPFVSSLLANQAPPTEAGRPNWHHLLHSPLPPRLFFSFSFFGLPCNSSHSCWFDTLQYKGNTSNGSIVISGIRLVGQSGKSCGTCREHVCNHDFDDGILWLGTCWGKQAIWSERSRVIHPYNTHCFHRD